MPATIVVVSGVSMGMSYGIESPVLRRGSDPDAYICLPSPDLPQHALTLEYHGGAYHVYNRSPDIIRIADQPIEAGGVAIWPAGQQITLPGDLRLQLDINGDPTPMPRPQERHLQEILPDEPLESGEVAAATASPTAAGSGDSPLKIAVQIGVIMACVLAMGVILAVKMAAPQKASKASAEGTDFTALVVQAQEALTTANDAGIQTLLTRLQQAEAARVRGNRDIARQRFGRLRDELLARQNSAMTFDTELEQSMYQYVTEQLAKLSHMP